MKARLQDGKTQQYFQVQRGDGWEEQCCPFSEMEFCGSWCPAFRVAENWTGNILDGLQMVGHVVRLSCFPQPVEYEVEESDV